MDDHTLPTSGARNLKRSKTDQFGKGAKIFLGRTDCPIHIHTSSCCSFQLNCKPRYCTRSRLQIQQWSPPHKAFVYQAHKDNLQELHKDSPIRNLRDSFHIGAATETAKRGVEDLIKTLRRWGGGAVQHTSGCHWNSQHECQSLRPSHDYVSHYYHYHVLLCLNAAILGILI